jgi:hypothetical protein
MTVELFEPPRVKSRRPDANGQSPLFPWVNCPRLTSTSGLPAIVESGTSCAAARKIADAVPRLRDRLLAHFRKLGRYGATDEEAAIAVAIQGNSYRPRRVALAREGLIVAVGKRLTRSGNAARVWRLAGEVG